jgi:hypothetical protein
MKQCINCHKLDLFDGAKFNLQKIKVPKYFGGDICNDCLPDLTKQMKEEKENKKKETLSKRFTSGPLVNKVAFMVFRKRG